MFVVRHSYLSFGVYKINQLSKELKFHIPIIIFYMEIANAEARATTRTELPHTHKHNTHTHPSTQPLTWQHDVKSLAPRKQVDGSTVR